MLRAPPMVQWGAGGSGPIPGIAALLLVQCVLATSVLDNTILESWYTPTLLRQPASTLHYIQDELPGEAVIAGDYVVSSAVLAQTTHSSVVQPKYETTRSRSRMERFIMGLHHAPPAESREILRRDLDVRNLLFDVPFLWKRRYEAGLPIDAKRPPPGSAAFSLLTNDASAYGRIPGYGLLYESSPRAPRYRLYELVAGDEASARE